MEKIVGASGIARKQFNERGLCFIHRLWDGLIINLVGIWHCGPDHNEYAKFYCYSYKNPYSSTSEKANVLFYDDIQVIFTGRYEDHSLRALRRPDGFWLEESLWTDKEIKEIVGDRKFSHYLKNPFCYGPAGEYFTVGLGKKSEPGPLRPDK